jgi:hypothetical protein
MPNETLCFFTLPIGEEEGARLFLQITLNNQNLPVV